MSYTMPPQPDAPRARPGTVTAATYLLFALAVLQVASGLIGLSSFGAVQEATRLAYQDFPQLRNSAETIATISVVVGVLIAVLFAAGFVVLGILDGKGKNAARIVTWVVAGIGVCCFGAGVAGRAANSALAGMGGGNTNGPDPAEVQRLMDAELPSWYYPATTSVSVLALLAAIAVIVVLALPSSNEFFRKPPPTWEPAPGYPSVG